MPNEPRLQPIWTPDDARQVTEAARSHPTFTAQRDVFAEVHQLTIRPRRLRRLAICAVIVAALAGLAIGTAVGAKADTEADLDKYGDAICEVLDQYPSADGIGGIGLGLVKEGMTVDRATDLIFLAAATKCPQQLSWLNRFAAPTGTAIA
jgi:hypothetical protein